MPLAYHVLDRRKNPSAWPRLDLISDSYSHSDSLISKTSKETSRLGGFAFLEFISHEKAEEILKNFNGKKINNLELKFNWVKSLEEKLSIPQIKKFTVKNFI